MTSTESSPNKSYLQGVNGPIVDSDCANEYGEGDKKIKWTFNDGSGASRNPFIWRVVVLTEGGNYDTDWKQMKLHPDSGDHHCEEDADNLGFDCYDVA